MICNLYQNILLIGNIYEFMMKDKTIKEYLQVFEKDILSINNFCKDITECISENIDIELANELDNVQGFETNFIKCGVDEELDTKTILLSESESKLDSIKNYLNNLIHDKGKNTEFIRIHETEKNNFGLTCTNRRCKLLQSALPYSQKNITLEFTNNVKINIYSGRDIHPGVIGVYVTLAQVLRKNEIKEFCDDYLIPGIGRIEDEGFNFKPTKPFLGIFKEKNEIYYNGINAWLDGDDTMFRMYFKNDLK